MGASCYKREVYDNLANLLFYRFDHDGPLKKRPVRELIEIAADERGIGNCKGALKVIYDILSPDYRFEFGEDSGEGSQTKGHTLGNLILAALMLKHGNIGGIRLLGEGLDSAVYCVPVSESPYTLHITAIDGNSLTGEHRLDEDEIISPVYNVTHSKNGGGKVDVNPEVWEKLPNLRRLSLCATSMVANLWGMMLPEIREYIQRSSFPLDFWVNLMTEQNQTHYVINGFVVRLDLTQHVALATKITGRVPDVVVAHDYGIYAPKRRRIPNYIQERYARKHATPVQCTNQDEIILKSTFDQSPYSKIPMLLRRSLAIVGTDIDNRQKVIRHDPERIEKVFEELLEVEI